MSKPTLDDNMRMARKACASLFAQVPEEVARSVTDAVDAAITGYATLQQQLATMTAERDKLVKCAYMGPMRDCPTHGETQELKLVKQQLAVVTTERDDAVRIAKELVGLAPITDADIRWAEALLAAKKHQEGLP